MFLIKRKWTVLALLLITPIGFYTKFYTGPASAWVNNSLGGILYVIFWSLLVYLCFSNITPPKIATVVFCITCILEILQLWHPPFLQFFRSYFIGRTILGTSFLWSDFLHYFIGFILSWLILRLLKKLESEFPEQASLT